MRAIQITEFGGPEVLIAADLPEPEIGPGFQRLQVSRAGVNYADTHASENSYLSPQTLPMIPGAEAVGIRADGKRVVSLLTGGYAEVAAVHDGLSFEVPDEVSDGAALALILQGTTAWHLLRTSAHLARGESVVVHAGAGGVGTLAIQLAKLWGAGRVIATASSESKRELATSLGAHVTVDPAAEDLSAALKDANGGSKVDVVLEMTGGPVFDQSLAALAPFGRLVTFGMASRTQPSPIQPGVLMGKSQAVIGFWLVHCMAQPQMIAEAMTDLLALTAKGELKPVVGGEFALSDAGSAHRALLDRSSVGKLVLDPAR